MHPDIVIVGLGNPGERYEQTRHNIGAMVVAELGNGVSWNNGSAWVTIGDLRAELVQPTCFYNESGSVVSSVLKKHNLTPEQLIVIHDDIDLNFGEVKKVVGRGSGGNKGVESIISALGTNNFTRIRIGIIPQNWLGNFKKPNKHKIPDFVLKPFSKKEQKELSGIIETVITVLMSYYSNGG